MGKKKSKAKQQRRSYQGAVFSRLNSDWVALSTSADAEIWSNLRTLRNRSRDLIRNNDYASGALRTILSNVLGESGIRMQSKILNQRGGKLNNNLNSNIEALWEQWHKAAYCDVAGRLSWQQFERLALRSVVESGEVIIRKIYKGFRGSPVPFALQIIESDQLADEMSRTLKVENGNQVRMGVEVDQWLAPVAYHIYPYHPGDNWAYPAGKENRYTPVRVPADEIIHLYLSDRPGQTRGVPWFASCLSRLRHMGGYEEAEIVKARSQACTMGFIQTPDPQGYGVETEGSANRQVPFEPGSIQLLEPGEVFNGFSPTSPNQGLGDFLRFMLRGVSAGIGVGYEAIARDYSQTSYSSQRASMLEDRDLWRTVQSWLSGALHQNVYEAWIDSAVMARVLNLPGFEAYEEQYKRPSWVPRGWLWIDPSKDVTASKDAIASGLSTLGRELASQGVDLDELVQERQREIELLKATGISVEVYPETVPQPPEKPTDGQPQAPIAEGLSPVRSIALEPVEPKPEDDHEITINLNLGDLVTKKLRAEEIEPFGDKDNQLPEISLFDGMTPVRGWDALRAAKPKKCKAKPCGNSCIAKSKACLADLSPEQKKLAQKAQKAMQGGGTPVAAPLPNAPAIAPTPVQTTPQAAATDAAKPKETKVSINKKELDKKRAELVDQFTEVQVEKAEANVKKLLEDSSVYMKVPNSEVMALVLGDKFKTAHEIGGRPGAPPPGTREGDYLAARARVEKKVCGISSDTNGADRPKYGYLGSKDLNAAEHLEVAGAYGNITVEFKDEVRSRSTFTGADSFKSGIASKIDDPNAASLVSLTKRGVDQPIGDLQDAQLIRAANSKSIAELAGNLAPTGNAYLEAQIHGQLTPSDVKALHFRPSGYHDYPTPEVAKLAKEKGIDIYINGKLTPHEAIKAQEPPADIKKISKAISTGDLDTLQKVNSELNAELTARSASKKPMERDADNIQTLLAEKAGYAATPKVVSTAEFNKLAKAQEGHVMYRGVQDVPGKSADEIQKQFQSGQYFTGHGVYGHGNYFAHSSENYNGVLKPNSTNWLEDESAKSAVTPYAGGANGKGKIIRAILPGDATIATSDQVISLQRQFKDRIDLEIKKKTEEIVAKGPKYSQSMADRRNAMRQEMDTTFKSSIKEEHRILVTNNLEAIKINVDSTYKDRGEDKTQRAYAYYSHDPKTKRVILADVSEKIQRALVDNYESNYVASDGTFHFKNENELREAVANSTKIAALTRHGYTAKQVKAGDPTPAAERKAAEQTAELRKLVEEYGLRSNSVNSRFAILMGIDAVSVSATSGKGSPAAQYINILNRSKLIVDKKIRTVKEIENL